MARPPISQIPVAPSRQDPTNFDDQSAIFFNSFVTFEGQVNAVGTYLDNSATEVDNDRIAAEAARDVAVASTGFALLVDGATGWVSGGSYAAGDLVWSPLDFDTYRAKTTHSGLTTDPSQDLTNWTAISLGKGLEKTSDTGSAELPSGTIAQRDGSPQSGYLRFNNENIQFEGHNGNDWAAVGGKSSVVEIVASGTLPNGKPVIVKTDGTVEVVQEVVVVNDPPLVGTPVVFETVNTQYTSLVYDSLNQKVILTYKSTGSTTYGMAAVGTVSGTSISFGTPVVFNSANTSWISATYDSVNQKIVIGFQDVSNVGADGQAIVGTVSGNSISFGSKTTFDAGTTTRVTTTYDPSSQKVVIAYRDGGNSNFGTARVGNVSGTSISFGTPVVFESASTDAISLAYDASSQKVIVAYQDVGNSNFGTAIVGTVSGTSISFGTPVVFESVAAGSFSATYDPNAQKTVIAYSASSFGKAIVGTVSGTSISFGTPVVFENAAVVDLISSYDPSTQKVVVVYRDLGNSSFGTVALGTVSGTSITFNSPSVFVNSIIDETSLVYEPVSQKFICSYQDESNLNYGTVVVIDAGSLTQNLTTSNFIGFSDGSYTNGQTATIQVVGAVNEAQTGLTAGLPYYVQADGTLATTPDTPSVFAGTAISATKLIVKR